MKQKEFRSNRFIIDSFGWIEFFGEGRLAGKYAKYIENCTPAKYFTPSLILYEVYKKIRNEYSEKDAVNAVMHIDSITSIVEIDTNTAVSGAELSIEERLPMADAIIRAVGNKYEAKIITSNKHFKNLKNIVFIE